ncbi:hypothetical protein Q5P01_013270 [Channa striata]|uniref:Poly [ADP-ribose] polymerase 9 n=1 Tax=Channa striata TaxID=64152 RepID=A0AA88MM00_CHASR|nr:hypothetical protein Q5P01_013270 [Channa striata]
MRIGPRLFSSLFHFLRVVRAFQQKVETMDGKYLRDFSLDRSSVNIVKKCGFGLKDIIKNKFGCGATFTGVDQKKPTTPEKRFSAELKSGVKVSVWKADLTNFQVDAVVNAANNHLQHYGGLALALSEAGGPLIQIDSEIHINQNGDVKTGDAIVCDAWSLPCTKIIHAVGPQLDKYTLDISRGEPLLKRTIKSILYQVMKNRLNTVAIPAISSGLFNYPLHECANTIVSTVKDYYEDPSVLQHLPQEIKFVNNDEPTVKEMERACRVILGPSMSMTYSQAAGSRSTGAAKTSTSTVKIKNVLLTLKKGKIEDQQTDVIVNTTSPELKLDSGRISKALLDKAGPGIQQELRRATYTGSLVTTKPHKLQCKEVYHTVCIESGKDTAQQVLYHSVWNCLMRAAGSQHSSIAFPAIGTGGLGFSKKDVAAIMSKAVAEFAEITGNMMDVYFVIFPSDDDTFQAFEKHMTSLHQNASNSSFRDAVESRVDFYDTAPTRPQINLTGPSDEAVCEAVQWLSGLFKSSDIHISNNFIQHFGEWEYMELSSLTSNGISIEESFVRGQACISIKGPSHEDVVVTGLQVEAMLCKIQREFVTEEEDAMFLMSTKKPLFERKRLNHSVPLFSDLVSAFRKERLKVVKIEEVENPVLEKLFELKKKQLQVLNPLRMIQRVPAQFCEMVCRIGFHAECAPPEEPAYGEGIYFTKKLEKAMELWKQNKEKYLYFVEAEVLKGNSTNGKPGLILPPEDPHTLYHSVTGGADISVIFSSYQALPRFIITCELM